MMLSHQSGSCGKTDGFRKLGKFQEGYLQRGTAYRRGRAAGVREPEGECKPPGPARGGGAVTTRRAGGKQEGRSPANEKRESPRGCLTLKAVTFGQVTACPRPPDLPLGHFTGPTHWVLSTRNLWMQTLEMGLPWRVAEIQT